MALNPSRALSATLPPVELDWTARDVALYHLGIGAGAGGPGSDLQYLLEDRLAALPTFAALACFPGLIQLNRVPGLESIDPRRVLHGEHEIELRAPVPPAGRVLTTGSVTAVERKRSGALISVRQESHREDGTLAWVNRYSVFAVGAVDFADTGRSAESSPRRAPPECEPELVIEVPTLPQQAMLYRHSGDDNPLHLDPEYASAGGFKQPILQGLCSLGLAVRVITDALFDGDPGATSQVAARFTGTVVPGQRLKVAAWRLDGGVAFEAETVEGDPVLGLGFLA